MIRCLDLPLSELDNQLLGVQLRCVYLHLAHSEDRWECSAHTHEQMEIGYIRKGNGSYHIAGESFTANAGDVFVIPQNVSHYELHNADTPFEILFLIVEVTGSDAAAIMEICGRLMGKHHLAQTERIRRIFEDIVDEVVHRKPGYLCAIDGSLKALLLSILRANAQSVDVGNRSQEQPTLHTKIIAQTVKHYIGEILDSGDGASLSIEALASHFYYHPKYLTQIFKQETGRTVTEYLADTKISLACRFLAQEQLSIDEIWKRLGCANVQHFYRAFKKRIGTTPANYRTHYFSAPQDAF